MSTHPANRATGLRRLLVVLAAIMLTSATACGGGGFTGDRGDEAEEFSPKNPTLIAAGSPGGGLDTHARMLSDAIGETDVTANFSVENIGGGGGNPARSSLLDRPNNGNTVVVESNRIFLAPLIGTTEMTLEDFTPLAKLTTDYLVWAVRDDSKFTSATQVLDSVKDNPKSVSFGVGTVPSDDQINVLQAAENSGVEDLRSVNIVAFESGGDLLTNLLGGHVDVISTGLSEVAEQVEAGDVRLLSISAPESQGGPAEGAPTWNELGIDFTLDHWRGVFGPADMPENAVQWWESTIKAAIETEAWQQQAEKLQLETDYQPGQEFLEQSIEPQLQQYEDLLTKVGLLD